MNITPHINPDFAASAKRPTAIASGVESKAERVSAKAEAHYERHAKAWVSARYTKLLMSEGSQPSLRPHGAVDDRKAHLFRAASHLVQRKQQVRLLRIERAAQRMSGLGSDAGIGR